MPLSVRESVQEVERVAQQPSTARRAVFTLLPAVVLLVAGELCLRAFYYQQRSEHTLALSEAVAAAGEAYARWEAKRVVAETAQSLVPGGETGDPRILGERINHALFTTDYGRVLLATFKKEYEEHFRALAAETRTVGSRLLLLYIPSLEYSFGPEYRQEECRAFFRGVASRAGADFIDVTEALAKHPRPRAYLLPHNAHLSRFGYALVASELAAYVRDHPGARSSHTFPGRPRLLGDLPPGKNTIWGLVPSLPFRFITNEQGLRRARPLVFPKTSRRVLVLGDSFTFGPYVANHDTYPAQAERLLENVEVINGGVMGYSIFQELALFRQRARYVEPDITVVQVLDNDLFGLFSFMKNQLDRQRRVHEASAEEKAFLAQFEKDATRPGHSSGS